MRFFIVAVWGSVLVQAALKFTVPSWTNVVTGVPFVVTWSGNNGAIALSLKNGTASNPVDVNPIASSILSNSYAWTPGNKATVGGTFFLKIQDAAGNSATGDSFVVLASTGSSSTTSTLPSTSGNPVSSTSASSLSSGSQTSNSAAPQSSGEPGGLSSGAKVGLGVGISLGVSLLGGLAAFAFLRMKKRKSVAAVTDAGTVEGKSELPGTTPKKQAAEMPVQPPEMDSEPTPVRHELA